MSRLIFAALLAMACIPGFAQVPNHLLISEVLEGTSGNLKYVEIHNPTSSTIDLADGQISLRRYTNAGTAPTTVPLTGTVSAGDFYVVANNLTDYSTAFPAVDGFDPPDQTTSNVNHNGNDNYDLHDGAADTVIDNFAADRRGIADNYAINMATFRRVDALPNNGDWGGAVVPANEQNSPSGFWHCLAMTGSNGNAADIGTPGFNNSIEVPVTLSEFGLE